MHELTIVGGTVAALVAALAAARRGRQVVLCVDPGRVGGSFAGVVGGGRRLDVGPRLFELDYEGSIPCPVSAFDPVDGTHRPVIHAVAAFIRAVLGDALCPAVEPQMWIGGGVVRCPLMTVDLAGFAAALPAGERALIGAERRTAAEAGATLEQASLAQHGASLHARLIAPICAKQHPGWAGFPAADRRKLWAALFHAETVSQAFGGGPVAFRPHRPVATTRTHQAYPFVDGLVRAIQAEPRIAVRPTGPLTGFAAAAAGRVVLRFGDHEVRVAAGACVIGTAPDQAFRAAALPWSPARIAASILWLDVPGGAVRHAPSALLAADPAVPVLRVSDAGSREGRTAFAVEFGAAAACSEQASSVLHQAGLVCAGAVPRVVHALSAAGPPAPTVGNRAAFQAAAARIAATGVHLLAGARRFGFDSLNDQIADGLHFGDCRC